MRRWERDGERGVGEEKSRQEDWQIRTTGWRKEEEVIPQDVAVGQERSAMERRG